MSAGASSDSANMGNLSTYSENFRCQRATFFLCLSAKVWLKGTILVTRGKVLLMTNLP